MAGETLECPECSARITVEGEFFRLTCPVCKREWRIEYKYHWLWWSLGPVLGFAAAYVGQLEGLLFLLCILVFAAVFQFTVMPSILLKMPKRLVPRTGGVQTLGIRPPKE
jgi:hypothetical protein